MWLAKETVVGVGGDHAEDLGQRRRLRAGRVTVPLAVGPLPIKLPDRAGPHPLNLGDGLFHGDFGPIKTGAHVEQLDRLPGKPLPLPHLVAQAQRWPTPRPEHGLDRLDMLGDFKLGKGHGKRDDVGLGAFAGAAAAAGGGGAGWGGGGGRVRGAGELGD
jgi:hypothetical protein